MKLDYDFDIQFVFPREMLGDLEAQEVLHAFGMSRAMRDNFVALFRSQATVDAILGADPVLKDMLKASGFDFTTYDSGAGEGFIPAEEEPYYKDVIQRLPESMDGFDLEHADLNGFDFGAFLLTCARAKALGSDTMPAETQDLGWQTSYAPNRGRGLSALGVAAAVTGMAVYLTR